MTQKTGTKEQFISVEIKKTNKQTAESVQVTEFSEKGQRAITTFFVNNFFFNVYIVMLHVSWLWCYVLI